MQTIMCTLHLEEDEVTVTQDPCTCYTEQECAAAYPNDAPDAEAANAEASSADDRDRGLG